MSTKPLQTHQNDAMKCKLKQLQGNLSFWANVIVSWKLTCKSVMSECHPLWAQLFNVLRWNKCEIELTHPSKTGKLLSGKNVWSLVGFSGTLCRMLLNGSKSRFIRPECLCVFSRLQILTSMSRNFFLQTVYLQSMHKLLAKRNVQKYIFLELIRWEIWITKPHFAFTFSRDCL